MANAPLVLNPRPPEQAQNWEHVIESCGFKAINIPLVESRLLDNISLKPLLAKKYDGIFFSSPSAISQFYSLPLAEKFRGHSVYSLSAAVEKKAEKLGLPFKFGSEENSIEGFLKEYSPSGMENWLHPCSLKTRLKPVEFATKGIELENFPLYEPCLNDVSKKMLAAEFVNIQILLFSSGSTVENLWDWLKEVFPHEEKKKLEAKYTIALGDSSAEALQKLGVVPGQICKMGELEKALKSFLNLAKEEK